MSVMCGIVYLFIGYLLGKIYGYKGLVEILIWPITICLILWLKIKK